ncbi:hypothetical protein L2E82_32701 [Cichorium intybus]|uniref:Uncharacterized protein n=1 Tax=Cichorium intybus TaxID=13427 RepID=A0ACB9BH61_CICIN|nr:hypothetical protein L2E82_32701 [Cichorium intybus]
MMAYAKTIDQQRLYFFHKTKGTGESPDVEEHGIDSTLHGKIPMKDNDDKSNHNQENRNNLEFISDQNSEHQSG